MAKWKVKKFPDGWYVVSKRGNPQSGPYPTEQYAEHYLPGNASTSVRTVSGGLPGHGKRR